MGGQCAAGNTPLWKLTENLFSRMTRKLHMGRCLTPTAWGMQGEVSTWWVGPSWASTHWRSCTRWGVCEEDAEHYKKGHYTVSSKSFAIVTGHQGNYMLFSRSMLREHKRTWEQNPSPCGVSLQCQLLTKLNNAPAGKETCLRAHIHFGKAGDEGWI